MFHDYVIIVTMTGTHILAFSAIIFYLASALLIGRKLLKKLAIDKSDKNLALLFGFAGLLLHAFVVHDIMIADKGVNLSFTNAASIVAWLTAALLLIGSIKQPMESLAMIFFPLAAISLGISQLFPSQNVIEADLPSGLQIHILFSIIAYSLLSIAAVQALILAIADARLKNRHPVPVMRILPPLQTIETLLFQFIWLGFILLTVSFITGFPYVEDIFGQHLIHKTVLSICAWITFAILLWGRTRFGWRGRTAVRFTIAGMIALVLAYFGSKAVLELVLQRL
ncbi:MAG: inner membrane protein YpjD [Gammaproteobacteria bacterium]